VETERIELSSAGCRPAVLPLNDAPMVAEVGIEPDLMAAYETAVRTSSSSPQKPGAGPWNRTTLIPLYQSGAHPESMADMEPCARIELASRLYRSRASPAMLAGPRLLEPAERIERSSVAYHATALPLSYTGWSRRADSNRHLSVTRALFFPLNYFDVERVTGFEPVSGPWRGPILAARRYPPGASGENRTLLASLEGWNSTNEPHPLEIHSLTFNCQRTHFGGSAWTVRSLQP
jgi:hypothetical protein